jgi:hypothetical protein
MVRDADVLVSEIPRRNRRSVASPVQCGSRENASTRRQADGPCSGAATDFLDQQQDCLAQLRRVLAALLGEFDVAPELRAADSSSGSVPLILPLPSWYTTIFAAVASLDCPKMIRSDLSARRPWLEWAGKREARSFAVDPVALHIHERVTHRQF